MSQTSYAETAELVEQGDERVATAVLPRPATRIIQQREKRRFQSLKLKPFNYRQLFWKWHLYAGLFGSPILILTALTGAILVFGPEIDHALRPDLWHIEPPAGASLHTGVVRDQQLIDMVRGQYAKLKLNSYRQNRHLDEPYQFLLLTPGMHGVHDVWVNPYTGQIVGERFREWSLVRIAEQLHRRLLTGEVGSSVIEFITGWCIVLSLTGVYLWWPKSRRQLINGLVPTMRGSAYKVNWRLHNTVGAWSAVVLLLLAVTGMVFSTYSGAMYRKLTALTGGPKHERPMGKTKRAEGATPVAVDRLLEKASAAALPGTRFHVQLPREGGGNVVISTLRAERATWADRKDYATWSFDAYSGALTEQTAWKDLHPLVKFRQLSLVIHFGSIFGLPTKIVALVVCLAMPLLAVTGFLIWWWKRPGKAALAARQSATPANVPPMPTKPVSRWVVAGLVGLCLIFPTIGVSFFVVLAFEWLRAWWRAGREAVQVAL